MPWHIGSTDSNFTMQRSSLGIHRHPRTSCSASARNDRIDLLLDVDNGVDYPLNIDMVVPELPSASVEFDYQVVPVHPRPDQHDDSLPTTATPPSDTICSSRRLQAGKRALRTSGAKRVLLQVQRASSTARRSEQSGWCLRHLKS